VSTSSTSHSEALPARGQTAARQLRIWLYGTVVLLYLLVRIGKVDAAAPALSGLALAAVLVSLPASRWVARTLSTLFLAGGTWMLLQKGATVAEYLSGYGQMVYLLAVFVVVPVLSVPVKLGGYDKAIEAVLRGRVGGVFQLQCLTTALAFICGSFMSVAAIPVMMTSMAPVLASYPIANRVRFMSIAAICGYVLPILWTPVSGVVGTVLDNLRVDWLALFPTLFALSIAVLVANWAIFYVFELRGRNAPRLDEPPPGDGGKSALPLLFQMFAAILLLVGCIGALEYMLRVGLIPIVTMISIPFALAWSIIIGQGRNAARAVARDFAIRLPAMADQFAIFLGAGFFAGAMRISGFDHEANLMFLDMHQAIGSQMFLLLMPVMALAASFLGVHPLVAIALLGESLRPEVLGIPIKQLAVALIGSAVLTYMQGPFSGTLGLVQSINKVSSFRLALWNAPYAFAYFLLLGVAIMLV
jgi:hypothetical protein